VTGDVTERFLAAVAFVFQIEGEHSEDPSDPGGSTWWGISRRAYPDIPWPPTQDEAQAIYHRDYWMACRCAELPGQLAVCLFDAAVNQGAGAAIRLLQREVNTTEDGIIGRATLSAIRGRNHDELTAAFMARRAVKYAATDGFDRYGRGWMRRCFECYRVAVTSA
jgi:lysozyme family protein